MIGRLEERAQDIRRHNGVAPTAELLERAARCIEVMGREAAEDHYAVLSVAERFRIKHPSKDVWVSENWRDFVPNGYRDLIGKGQT